jgi:hypothetical protein
VVICHGFGCAFRTEIALTDADRAQMAAIMASGSASAQAERAAIGRTEAWFERRIAPVTGTAQRVARAGPLIGGALNRGQFDCIDTTNNTNSLLLVLDQLKLLQHHTIAAPVSRFLITEGPDMHKNIGAAVIRQDEAKSAIWVEEFDPPPRHAINPIQRTAPRPAARYDGPGLVTTPTAPERSS